ncbi:hypothetical protein [Mesorhizobium sp. M0220]|uniref:hypothetical protein n=1 Tax=Mesorhizobium sp. M0220 TaxID=2956920 RepID=UPI003339D80A
MTKPASRTEFLTVPSMDQWLEHVGEADLPAFRRAVVEGDWQALINHARAAAKMRLDLGI